MNPENQSEIQNRYVSLISRFYLNPAIDFNPTMDYVFVTRGIPYGGDVRGAYRKGVIHDFDGVFNAEVRNKRGNEVNVLPEYFFNALSRINTRVRNVRNSIDTALQNIMDLLKIGEDYSKEMGKLGEILRDTKLEREQYEKASEEAAMRLVLTPNTLEYVKHLSDMGYIISINSGSPQRALEILAERLNLPRNFVYGSQFYFENGVFNNIVSQLGYEKEKDMQRFLRALNMTSDNSVLVSDDPKADGIFGLKSGLGLMAWIDNRGLSFEDLPGEIKTYCPEARHNMLYLIPAIQKYEKARVLTLFKRNPHQELELIRKSHELEEIAEKCMRRDDNYLNNMSAFLATYNQLLGMLDPIFPIITSGVNDLYLKLQRTEDTGKSSSIISEIVSRIGMYTPEMQNRKITDRLIEDLVVLETDSVRR